jgi:hypothetical protein
MTAGCVSGCFGLSSPGCSRSLAHRVDVSPLADPRLEKLYAYLSWLLKVLPGRKPGDTAELRIALPVRRCSACCLDGQALSKASFTPEDSSPTGTIMMLEVQIPTPNVLKNHSAEVSHSPSSVENSRPPAIGNAQPGKRFERTSSTLAMNMPYTVEPRIE